MIYLRVNPVYCYFVFQIIISTQLFLLETYGLIVNCKGSGSVKKQSIKKGERFNKGSIIYLGKYFEIPR